MRKKQTKLPYMKKKGFTYLMRLTPEMLIRLELQVEQLIRIVAHLNESVRRLEEQQCESGNMLEMSMKQ